MSLEKLNHSFTFEALPGFVKLSIDLKTESGKQLSYTLLLEETKCRSLAAKFEEFADYAYSLKRDEN